MTKLLTVFALTLFITGFQLQAQVSTGPEKPAETQTTGTDTKEAMKCCHGAGKAGCCMMKGDASAKKSKKSRKGDASCCAGATGAKGQCCAQGKNGEHADKPCHPGCTMPCCAKKE